MLPKIIHKEINFKRYIPFYKNGNSYGPKFPDEQSRESYNLIILGNRYKFSTFEKEYLLKKFKSIKEINAIVHLNSSQIIELTHNIISNYNPRHVVVNMNGSMGNSLIEHLKVAENPHVKSYLAQDFTEKYLLKCPLNIFSNGNGSNGNGIPNANKYSHPSNGLIKRFIDIILSLLLINISFPLWLYSAYRIKRESPGAVLYKQWRINQYGRQFVCLKFRSMFPDAEENGARWAQNNDKRAFAYGRFMRKYHIDELPQLINVLKGDISLIGPRPERKVFVDILKTEIENYDHRHLVKPGITGWAQVNFQYAASVECARHKLMYDLYYIKHWSIWLDLKIIWKTIWTIIKQARNP